MKSSVGMKGAAGAAAWRVLAVLLLLGGCASQAQRDDGDARWLTEGGQRVYAPLEDPGLSETAIRRGSGEPDWSSLPRNRIAVALSGGGSKAAAFAMGVLAGLDDLDYFAPARGDPALPKVAFVSSVSGGSYAAYFLVSQIVANRRLGPAGQLPGRRSHLDFLFLDGVTHTAPGEVFADGLRQAPAALPFGRDALGSELWAADGSMANRQQSVVRCAQDVLVPGKCSVSATSQERLKTWGSNLGMLVPTVLTLPLHHLLNSVFDSGISVAPTRRIYQQGVGLTYGSTPLAGYRAPTRPLLGWPRLPCPAPGSDAAAQMHGCFENERSIQEALPLDFAELNQAWREWGGAGSDELPFWVIQASASRYRSIGGWLRGPERDAFVDSFEFTPLSYGSRRYGFVAAPHAGVSVLDAVIASAAFFDANQQVYQQRWQSMGLGLLQHGLNLNWGLDIPNYNVSEVRRRWHRWLPLPIAWLDSAIDNAGREPAERDRKRSAFIRLIDGGSSENTGAVAALRRGIKTLVIVDAAQDKDGEFGDLCYLKQSLEQLDAGKAAGLLPYGQSGQVRLLVPGLADFDNACAEGKPSYALQGTGPAGVPALLACLTTPEHDQCVAGQMLARILVIKPMLDLQGFADEWQGAGRPAGFSRCTHGGFLHAAGQAPENCAQTGSSACREAVPCEVGRLLVNADGGWRNSPFPQTSTVSTTGNSSATLYSAYRELARMAVVNSRAALTAAVADDTRFAEMARKQSGHFKSAQGH